MKYLILILVFSPLFMLSCTNDEILNDNSKEMTIVAKTIDDLDFKLNPTASDKFTFSIRSQAGKAYSLFLKKDDKELVKGSFVADEHIRGISIASIKYDFNTNDNYEIVIRATQGVNDTLYQEDFKINYYKHEYANRLNYEELVSVNQLLDFDLSPSRNVVFYNDYINNKCVLKRLTLSDNKVEVLDEDFFSLLIRSKSDNDLIVSTRNYENHFLEADSCAILNYNVNTKKSSFIDWGSADYGRFSRVVNNSIIISKPIVSKSVSYINFDEGSKKEYTADLTNLREHSFEKIYLKNNTFDFNKAEFTKTLGINDNLSYIVYSDENSGYYIVVDSYYDYNHKEDFSRLVIYKDDKIVFQEPFEKGKQYNFPRLVNLSDNKLIFFKSFDYASEVKLDGYYLLDLNTKEVTLLKNDDNNFVKNDFFIYNDNKSFISVRHNGIYKISM